MDYSGGLSSDLFGVHEKGRSFIVSSLVFPREYQGRLGDERDVLVSTDGVIYYCIAKDTSLFFLYDGIGYIDFLLDGDLALFAKEFKLMMVDSLRLGNPFSLELLQKDRDVSVSYGGVEFCSGPYSSLVEVLGMGQVLDKSFRFYLG